MFGQTGVSPVIVQVGFGLTSTVNWQFPGQLSRVMASVNVKEPAPVAVTFTDAPVVDPLMVPLPMIVQLCVTVAPAGRTVEV